MHRFSQPNKVDFQHAKFSLDTDIPRLFVSANSFCFLRLLFSECSPSSREELKKKKKRTFPEFSCSVPKSYLQVAREWHATCHALPLGVSMGQFISVETIFCYVGFSYGLLPSIKPIIWKYLACHLKDGLKKKRWIKKILPLRIPKQH